MKPILCLVSSLAILATIVTQGSGASLGSMGYAEEELINSQRERRGVEANSDPLLVWIPDKPQEQQRERREEEASSSALSAAGAMDGDEPQTRERRYISFNGGTHSHIHHHNVNHYHGEGEQQQ